MSETDEAGYLRISTHLFATALPKLIIVSLAIRYAYEWLTSQSSADFLEWLNNRWIFDLCVAIAAAAIDALTSGYKTWLGSSYTEWRRSRGDD